jgi:hypothetical protein
MRRCDSVAPQHTRLLSRVKQRVRFESESVSCAFPSDSARQRKGARVAKADHSAKGAKFDSLARWRHTGSRSCAQSRERQVFLGEEQRPRGRDNGCPVLIGRNHAPDAAASLFAQCLQTPKTPQNSIRFEETACVPSGGDENTTPFFFGWIAQLVEQRTENPRVAGSIPAPATLFHSKRAPAAQR